MRLCIDEIWKDRRYWANNDVFLVEGGDFITMNKRNYILTKEQQSQIEDFICYKEEQEVSQNTLIQYRKTLEIFFDFVSKGKKNTSLSLELPPRFSAKVWSLPVII